MKTPSERLRDCADLFEERNAIYGDSYKRVGDIIQALGLKEVHLTTGHQVSRFVCLIQMVYKFTRYCEKFESGGHPDSLADLSVYATMMAELDDPECLPADVTSGLMVTSGKPK